LQKEILLNTTKADIGHIETMTNEVKKALMAVFSFVLLLHIYVVQKKTS